jgi:hypothetical protein
LLPYPLILDLSLPLQPDEFKLQGKAYVRCCSLAKNPQLTKKRNSIIWIYGEDIQLRTNSAKRFWYCYLCEKRSRQQELPVVDKGNSTYLDHLKQAHKIDPKTGERITTCEAIRQQSTALLFPI